MRCFTSISSFAIVAAFAIGMGSANAATVLDQEFIATGDPLLLAPFDDPNVIGGTGDRFGVTERAQTFTVGLTGILTSVEVQLRGFASQNMLLQILTTSDSGGGVFVPDVPGIGTVLGSGQIQSGNLGGSPTQSVDLTSFNIAVTAGDILAIALATSSQENESLANPGWAFLFQNPTDNYSSGTAFKRNAGALNLSAPWGTPANAHDLGFRTYVDTGLEVVPVPAALPLFLSALAGMGFVGWRRKHHQTD